MQDFAVIKLPQVKKARDALNAQNAPKRKFFAKNKTENGGRTWPKTETKTENAL